VRGGLGPRFVLEAGFLIAVAIAAGLAELSATAIVVVMAVAWLLVCLFELAVWSEGSRFPTMERSVEDAEPEPPAPEAEPGAEPVAVRRDGEDA
jgi:hypothetical protein